MPDSDNYTPKRLIARFKKAKQVKAQWMSLLQDAYEFALPNRNLFYNTPKQGSTQGQRKIDRVFDSTAQTSTINFANRIQSDMMPPFHRFITLKAGPMVPAKFKKEVDHKLEIINEQLFAVLQASNWDTANNETLLELAIGTGCLFIFEHEDPGMPVMFVPAPIAITHLEEGPWGDIVGSYMEHNGIRICDIEYTWPDAKVPDELKNKRKDSQGEEPTVDLIACAVKDLKTKKWLYRVIWHGEGEKATEGGSVIVERDYDYQIIATPRWIKVAGETYGRGPVIQALPDIKTLNKLTELVLKNAALHISGVYTGVADNVLNPNKVQITPGAVIPVASNGGTRGPSLKALERTGSFDLAQLEWDRLISSIKRFLLDKGLPDDNQAQPRTATEIIARMRELAADIGAPYGRLVREYIVPVIQGVLHIMEKRGLVPKVRVDGLAVAVQVTSPLAQEQNLNEVESIVQWLQILASLGEELMILSARVEDAGPLIGEKLGVPAKLIRTTDEREKLQVMAGKLIKQQMAQQEAPAGTVNAGGELKQAA